MLKKTLPLIALFLFLLLSCHEEDTQTSFFPMEGGYGTLIKVYDHGLDSLGGYLNIWFEGLDDPWPADSVRSDTVYFAIPFGAESGDVRICDWPDSIILEDLQVNELGFDDIRMAWSDLNYRINYPRATYTISEYSTLAWRAEIRQDTVEIIGDKPSWEIRYEYHLVLKDLGTDTLPELIDAYTLLFNDYGGPGSVMTFPMENGLICIQDWQPGEKISGRVMSLPDDHNNYLFYYDFK